MFRQQPATNITTVLIEKKTSDNVAENAMMEHVDLGYGSWSDNTVLESLTSLDEFDLSAGSDNVLMTYSRRFQIL